MVMLIVPNSVEEMALDWEGDRPFWELSLKSI